MPILDFFFRLGAALLMCGFMVRDNSRGEGQIVSYMVSGIGFLGAGVIFKDAGSVRGLNTAATIWCSAAIGAISGLGNPLHALILTGLSSEDIEGIPRMRVHAQIKGLGRQDEALEQIVVRLSLEPGVTSVSWAVHTQVLE